MKSCVLTIKYTNQRHFRLHLVIIRPYWIFSALSIGKKVCRREFQAQIRLISHKPVKGIFQNNCTSFALRTCVLF